MVLPALAAVAVGLQTGIPLDTIVERLATVEPAPGRLQVVRLANGAFMLRDDFKSPMETVDAALDVLEAIPAHRKLVVFGNIQEPPGSQGPICKSVGERIARVASFAVFACGNFQRYAVGARRARPLGAEVADAGHSVGRAAALIRERLGPGDVVVLVKGRSSERLDRVALALAGRDVRCDLKACYFLTTRCEDCSLLSDPNARERTKHAFPFAR
jgi:UDP-N-acetylmuramoyl-tripeptide--D-alanyl-D-alanine ligase